MTNDKHQQTQIDPIIYSNSKKKEKMTRNFDTQLLIDMLLYINIGFYISILCTTSYW